MRFKSARSHTLGVAKGVGNREAVGLNPMLPSFIPAKSEPPVARTGQHPWRRPRWKILPALLKH